MGIIPFCNWRIFSSSMSAQVTIIPKSARHAPTTKPTKPEPTTVICTRASRLLLPYRFGQFFHPELWAGLVKLRHDAFDRSLAAQLLNVMTGEAVGRE